MLSFAAFVRCSLLRIMRKTAWDVWHGVSSNWARHAALVVQHTVCEKAGAERQFVTMSSFACQAASARLVVQSVVDVQSVVR